MKPKIVTTSIEVSNRSLPSPLIIISSTTFPPHNTSRLNINNLTNTTNNKNLYTQALKINLSSNVKDVLYIKEVFHTLSEIKVVEIIKITNNNME